MAVLDYSLAAEISSQMQEDVVRSQRVTVKQLRDRSLATRALDNVSWLIRREE